MCAKNCSKHCKTVARIALKTSPGAPPKVEKTIMDVFFGYAASPEGKSKTLKQLKAKFSSVKYSIAHLSRLLVKRGLRCFVQKKKPFLEPHHIKARLAFAKNNKHRNWDEVVFSDEKTVYSCFKGRKLIRRQRGETDTDDFIPTKAKKVKVNLWGFITSKYWGLYLLPNKAKGDDYLNLLKTAFLPEIRHKMDKFVFMQGEPM